MISLRGLSVKYLSTGRQAVAGLSLNLQKGERLALLGPSGCGKTTALRALLGLLRYDEAEVSGTINKNSCKISAVFQRPALLPWYTVRANVALPLMTAGCNGEDAGGRLTNPLLKMCGLEQFAEYLPHQLSAGMQQRVSFLRALAVAPDLIVMDEPFSSLDVASKQQLMADFLAILREKNISALFVTHDIREALAMGDRIIVLTSSPAALKKEYSLAGLSAERKDRLFDEIVMEYEN